MAGFNTYAYAGGNPIMYADPTGQLAQIPGIAIGFGIGAFVGGGLEAGFQIYTCGYIYDPWAVAVAAVGGGIGGAFAVATWGMGVAPYMFWNGVMGGAIGGTMAAANGGNIGAGVAWGFIGGSLGAGAGKGIAAVAGKVFGSAGQAGAG